MAAINRTAIIYKQDEFHPYIAMLIYDDRAALTMQYADSRDMISDILEHIVTETPCVMYGKPYNGEVHGLAAVISKDNGGVSVKFNTTENIADIADIFRNIRLMDLLNWW